MLLRCRASWAVVVTGESGTRKILTDVTNGDDLAMPADKKISDQEIATLKEWVAAGVPWTSRGRIVRGDVCVDVFKATHCLGRPSYLPHESITAATFSVLCVRPASLSSSPR